MNYWLFKSEPDVFSIDDLKAVASEPWDGVRNYQARNFMRDDMKKGDLGFFYHSNTKEPGIYGILKIVREGYPDHTAFDKTAKYFDPKSKKEKPTWYMVDVKFVKKFKKPVLLSEMKDMPALAEMKLLQKGNRLSVMPVDPKNFKYIESLTSSLPKT